MVLVESADEFPQDLYFFKRGEIGGRIRPGVDFAVAEEETDMRELGNEREVAEPLRRVKESYESITKCRRILLQQHPPDENQIRNLCQGKSPFQAKRLSEDVR